MLFWYNAVLTVNVVVAVVRIEWMLFWMNHDVDDDVISNDSFQMLFHWIHSIKSNWNSFRCYCFSCCYLCCYFCCCSFFVLLNHRLAISIWWFCVVLSWIGLLNSITFDSMKTLFCFSLLFFLFSLLLRVFSIGFFALRWWRRIIFVYIEKSPMNLVFHVDIMLLFMFCWCYVMWWCNDVVMNLMVPF